MIEEACVNDTLDIFENTLYNNTWYNLGRDMAISAMEA
jgi:hypothetical protein